MVWKRRCGVSAQKNFLDFSGFSFCCLLINSNKFSCETSKGQSGFSFSSHKATNKQEDKRLKIKKYLKVTLFLHFYSLSKSHFALSGFKVKSKQPRLSKFGFVFLSKHLRMMHRNTILFEDHALIVIDQTHETRIKHVWKYNGRENWFEDRKWYQLKQKAQDKLMLFIFFKCLKIVLF